MKNNTDPSNFSFLKKPLSNKGATPIIARSLDVEIPHNEGNDSLTLKMSRSYRDERPGLEDYMSGRTSIGSGETIKNDKDDEEDISQYSEDYGQFEDSGSVSSKKENSACSSDEEYNEVEVFDIELDDERPSNSSHNDAVRDYNSNYAHPAPTMIGQIPSPSGSIFSDSK